MSNLTVYLTILALAAIKRPKQAEWHRLVLANMRRMARQLSIQDDSIEFWIGQSRGHKGIANAYELRCADTKWCFNGHHGKDRVTAFNSDNLRGPISRAQLQEWMEACPDYHAPSGRRPGPESHRHV